MMSQDGKMYDIVLFSFSIGCAALRIHEKDHVYIAVDDNRKFSWSCNRNVELLVTGEMKTLIPGDQSARVSTRNVKRYVYDMKCNG